MAELSTPRVVVIALVVGVAAYAAVALWQANPGPAAPPEATTTELPPGEVDGILQRAEMQKGDSGPPIVTVDQTPRSTGIGKFGPPAEGAVVFPDGTWLPATNGVKNPPPFPGFGGRDYAPVVRFHTDARTGSQWYIHANGSVSSVQMSEHHDGTTGETNFEAAWVVGHPTRTLPLVR